MTIVYFGDFDPDYPRQKILIRGLKLNGAKILICNSRKKGFAKYKELWAIHNQLPRYDILLVGHSDNHLMAPFARLISRRPIVWDCFYSIYDNWVHDRKLVNPYGLKAIYYWLTDWLSFLSANLILSDTQSNIGYFVKTFCVSPKKCLRILIGADDSIMFPQEKTVSDKFIVEFHGSYGPVQGLEYIVRAAKLLENETDIHFQILGSGQDSKKIKALADELKIKNITFLPYAPHEELPKYIKEADVCLGLLGTSDRGARAIPHKVYEASAMRRASLNMDGPGIRELYTDRENILLCRGGNPRDIADKILELKNNPVLKNKIAENAYQLFLRYTTPKILGRLLWTSMENIVHFN